MGPESWPYPRSTFWASDLRFRAVSCPGSRTHWLFTHRIQRPAMTPKWRLSMLGPQKILPQGNDNPTYPRKHLPSSWYRSVSPPAWGVFVWIRNGHSMCGLTSTWGGQAGQSLGPTRPRVRWIAGTTTRGSCGEYREDCAVRCWLTAWLCYLLTVWSRESCPPLRCLSPQT